MVDSGLANQSWKQLRRLAAFPGPHVRRRPIAAVEVQGYVYDAKRGLAQIAPARSSPATSRSPSGWSARRTSCVRASTRRSGSTTIYAVALDGAAAKVDARSSNMASLRSSTSLPTGWGIRTMASDGGGVQPDQLPQRHVLAARHGPRRLGRCTARVHGGSVVHRMRADRGSGPLRGRPCWRRSPATLATETPFPIAYPTATRRCGPPARRSCS